jgi:hypothetical protein
MRPVERRSDEPLAVRLATRGARLVVTALIVGLGISSLYFAAISWSQTDAAAYWEAALRLRNGEPLYPAVADVEASNVYRYSPWFAWAAVPFTLLPVQAAAAIWSAILVASSCAACIPLIQRRAWLLVAFFFPVLIGISAIGNVHPLMVAWLVLGLERRTGPFWIALAASLKAAPLFLVLAYVARRQWWRAAITLVLTALLVAPVLLYDLSGYTSDPGDAGILIGVPVLFVAAIAAAASVTWALGRTPYVWLGAATTAVMALPRFFVYDITLLMAAVPWRGPEEESSSAPR